MSAPLDHDRRGYSRLETDDELVARVRLGAIARVRFAHETVDEFADRWGYQRRIVWCLS